VASDYIAAANKMRPKAARQRVVAYVESYDDIFFWRSILSQYENDSRYFEVMLPSKKNLSKGKKSVLMNLIRRQVGQHMIACVDADYDYLLQGTTEVSREVNDSPYVFHTYAYAIENLQCYAPSLHNVCVGVTLNDHYSITPSTTVCGLFVCHPEARYFTVGRIDDEQQADYAKRRNPKLGT
jgi:hypothetical protein